MFECSLAKSWLESGTWSAAGLLSKSNGNNLVVKRSRDRFFMYSEDGRSDLLKDYPNRKTATEVMYYMSLEASLL